MCDPIWQVTLCSSVRGSPYKLHGNNFNYFPENQLTKLARLVQLQRMLIGLFYLKDCGRGAGPLPPFPCLLTAYW